MVSIYGLIALEIIMHLTPASVLTAQMFTWSAAAALRSSQISTKISDFATVELIYHREIRSAQATGSVSSVIFKIPITD